MKPYFLFITSFLLFSTTFSLHAQYEDIHVKAIRKNDSILLLNENDSMLCVIKNCPEQSTIYSTDSIITFSISKHSEYDSDCNGYEIEYRRYYRSWRHTHYTLSEKFTFYVIRRYPYRIDKHDHDYVCLEFKKMILRPDKFIIFFHYNEKKTQRNFEIYYPFDGEFNAEHFSEQAQLQLKSQEYIYRNYQFENFEHLFLNRSH